MAAAHWAPSHGRSGVLAFEGNAKATLGVYEGQVVDGKYRIERVLGKGAMGLVVAARHLKLGERVALKFLFPEMLGNRDAVARFAREATAMARIKSEYVARVFDVGTLPTGAPYMVMEFLEGADLAARLRTEGALPVEQAAEFVIHACSALAEAHGRGIIHRDVKPANLFCVLGMDGQYAIKVLDFGISKANAFHGSGASMTRSSAIIGSPLYMSPEQMTSARDVDFRTDIWALGVVLYELLTGRVPFEGETLGELAVKAATVPPAPIHALRPDAPPGLQAVVFKCLEKERDDRYRDVGELANALAYYAPPRAQVQVERIAGILRASSLDAPGVAATALSSSAAENAFAARDEASVGHETLPPMGRTTGGSGARSLAPSAQLAWVVAAALVSAALVGGVTFFYGTGPTNSGRPPSPAASPVTSFPFARTEALSAAAPAGVAPMSSILAVDAPPDAVLAPRRLDGRDPPPLGSALHAPKAEVLEKPKIQTPPKAFAQASSSAASSAAPQSSAAPSAASTANPLDLPLLH
jgi:serine/threonine-protein kinase